MKTDCHFYRLFQYAPELLLELAGLYFRDEPDYSFRSEEIKQTAFRLDGLMIPPSDQQNLLVISVEVQLRPNHQFYSRFFCEIIFLSSSKQTYSKPGNVYLLSHEKI